jgi:hypothetical protein
MNIFKYITSMLMIFLLLVTFYLAILTIIMLVAGFGYDKKYFILKFSIYIMFLIVFLIFTILFINSKKYNTLFIILYFIITLIISHNFLPTDLIIKYIPLVLSSIYMLLNRKLT